MRFLKLTLGLALHAASALAWVSSGQLQSTTDIYAQRTRKSTGDLAPFVNVELRAEACPRADLRWRFRGTLLSNPDAARAPDRLHGDVREGFVEYARAASTFRVGMDTVDWSLVSVASPSDMVNTEVLFHPLRPLKRGAPMLSWTWAQPGFELQALYIPRQARPLLPSPDSRWWPRSSLNNVNGSRDHTDLPEALSYDINGPETLNQALAHNVGARARVHAGALDLQLTYFEGAAPRPKTLAIVAMETDPFTGERRATSPVLITPLTYRVRTTGAGLTWTGAHWTYRVESAYQHTVSRHPVLAPSSWTSAAGVETTFDVDHTPTTWFAQYSYTRTPQAPDNFLSSLARLYDNTLVIGARWPTQDDVTVVLSALYAFDQSGLLWTAGFEQKLSEALRWSLTWRDLSGTREGFLKTFDSNDHATLELTYIF